MASPREICTSILVKYLSRYLEVDDDHVSACLLSRDGTLLLQDVRIKPRKIPWKKRPGRHTTYLSLSGTISRLCLSWTWLSFLNIKESCIEVEGLRLVVDLTIEKDDLPSSPDRTMSFMNDDEDDDGENEKQQRSLFFYFKEEHDRIMASIHGIVPSSEILRRAVVHVLSALSIKFSRVEVRIMMTRDDSEMLLGGQVPSFHLVVSLKQIEYVPQRSENGQESANTTNAVKLWRQIDCHIGSFSINFVDNGRQLPVVEPFSYSGTVRRHYGMSYIDFLYGYEFIGRLAHKQPPISVDVNGDDNGDDNDDESVQTRHDAVVFHLGKTRLGALCTVNDLLFGTSTEKPDKNMPEDERRREEAAKRRRQTSRTFSKILRVVVSVLILLLCWVIYVHFSFIVEFCRQSFMAEHSMTLPSLLYHTSIASGCIFLLNYSEKLWALLSSRAGVGFRQAMNHDAAVKEPALFRVPLERVLVIFGADDDRLTLTKFSIVGRVDASLLNISAGAISLSPGSPRNLRGTPQMEGNDVRAVRNDDGWTVKFGTIHGLTVPNRVSITSPLVDTIVHYGDGKLDVRLDSLVGIKLDREKADVSAPRRRRKSLTVPGVPLDLIDKDKLRMRINEDITTELHKFHTIALMFEGIPLQTNKTNLWRYRDTFRGSDAVDYIMELNIARTRVEAVEFGCKLQTAFDLFQDVRGDVYSFKDDPDCLYRFVREDTRRNWERNFRSVRGATGSVGDDDVAVSQYIPFTMTMRVNKFTLNDLDGNLVITMLSIYGLAKPSTYIRALEVTGSAESIATEILMVTRARLHGYYHPDLPSEFHDVQYSVEYMKAAGGFSAESWYKTLGFKDEFSKSKLSKQTKGMVDFTAATTQKVAAQTKAAIIATNYKTRKGVGWMTSRTKEALNVSISMSKHSSDLMVSLPKNRSSTIDAYPLRPTTVSERDTSTASASAEKDLPKGIIRLPNIYISPFTLRLKLKGLFASSKETRIRVEKYEGNSKTTSNDIIVHFVTVVLARAPGMIGNMNVMGVNVAEGGGLFAGMMVGAAMIPGGQFIGMAAIAAMDGVNGAISAGKRSRNKPDDNYKVGDFFRGVVYGAIELNRKGALRRGKTDDDYYDAYGNVRVDVGDFAAGATISTGEYVMERKAKFVGGAVAAATMITFTVLAGPLVGLGLALVAGAGAEIAVNQIDKAVRKNRGKEDEAKDDDD